MPSRRVVLLGGLGATGALVVGYALWPSDRLARTDKLAAKAGERFVNNWIKIANDDTVTVVVPHCDMGTGIFTALPQMAAEELDADWSKVRVEAAPPDPLFANGAPVEDSVLAERHATRDQIPAFLRGTVDNTFRTVATCMNLQVTGGASTIGTTGAYAMRVAGAAARDMLVKAAAARWNVSPEDCATKAGRVIHNASGKSFRYGELAADAATYSPSLNPKIKARSQYTLVGKSVPRIDIPDKVNGATKYGIDTVVPGMLYAAIRIAPVFGAKLKSVETAQATDRRGVKKIVKLDDAVVVVADRFWRAQDAAKGLDPQFDNGTNGSVTSASIAAQRRAALDGELKTEFKIRYGANAIEEPGRRSYEAIYQVPYLAHAAMEPVNATALYKDGTLEVWAGAQDGLGARAYCADVAKLPLEKVTFHLMPMGGAFGRRLPQQWNYLTYAVKTAMAVPGAPVKLIFTREQDIQHDYYRPNAMSRMSASFDAKDMPLAWVQDCAMDDHGGSSARIPYAIPSQEYRTAKVPTHIPTGSWRGGEASWDAFFTESFIDELAHQMKADPLAYRTALLSAKPRHLAVLNKAAKEAGWGTPLPSGQGRGIALCESFGSIVAHVAQVEVSPEGALTVRRIVSAIDCGMAVNPDGVKQQIEGGIVFGLSAALHGAITIDKGAVTQADLADHGVIRMAECPDIDVHIVESDAPFGGAGEPGVPPVAPAVANAVFAATGIRIRELPLAKTRLAADPVRSASTSG